MMQNKKVFKLAAGIASTILAAGVTFQAQAVTIITFEGQANTIYNAPITRSGFNIGNVAGDEQHFHEIASNNFGLTSNGTGVLLNDRDTRIFVVDQFAATFTLGTVDVATAANNSPAVGITIEGFLNNVSTGFVTLANMGNGFTTLNGAALGTVDRLVFDGTGGAGGFEIDNLTLNAPAAAVPEPETYAMMLAGLGLLGVAARRRKQKVAAAA